jgi:hypothetical protein
MEGCDAKDATRWRRREGGERRKVMRREGSSESEAGGQAHRLIGSGREAKALRRMYADYASVAARPYARSSWEFSTIPQRRAIDAEYQIDVAISCECSNHDTSLLVANRCACPICIRFDCVGYVGREDT